MGKQRSNFFHTHAHTMHSTLDGMAAPRLNVERVVKMGQPGYAQTDHGNMGGIPEAYIACRDAGIKFFPGVEGYLLDPYYEGDLEESGKAQRYHFCVMALSEKGYQGLVKFTSKTYTRPRFSRFPRATLSDLAELGSDYGKHVAITTGCYFGLIQQAMLIDEAEAERYIKMYASWFPNTYVEVQHHNIDHENELSDSEMVKALIGIADRQGLPTIATQDSHYLLQKHKTSHALMKRMVYGGQEDEFPGDSFHLASAEWVAQHYTKKQWARFEQGYADLLDKNKVKITPLDNYVIDVPDMGAKPMKRLKKIAWERHEDYMDHMGFKGKKREKYDDELTENLSVVKDLGMPAYFLHWLDFTEWCRRRKIAIEARGSGNGFYLNYLLRITQIDPVKHGNRADRFLSRDRKKAPDIDLDIEDMRRGEALQYVFTKFPGSVQIGTWGALGITVDEETGEERGSVFTTWIAGKRRECLEEGWKREQRRADRCAAGKCKCMKAGHKKCLGTKPVKYRGDDIGKALFKEQFASMQGLPDVRYYDEDDWIALQQINDMKTVKKSYGVHAGGVLLPGQHVKIEDWIPTMLVASSDTRVSQYDMDWVEKFGLLKDDILGQTSLTVMRICQELMGREDPTDFQWIPEGDTRALRLLRTGRTNTGLFHFEGWTKSKGGKELGVKSVNDAILVQALYMPGCMDVAPGQSISMKDLYLKRRKDADLRNSVTYIHPAFEKHLSPTYGCVVYQEQVIGIMRDLGMSIDSVNKFFAVVKDSGKGAVERNKDRMAEVRAEFDSICKKNKIDPDEAWAQTASFVAYGFNKAHASGYGVRSYRTAYLKAHYPLEYMTALLQAWAGRDKEKVYLREARRMEIPILPPSLQYPNATWTMDKRRGAIRKGLVALPGIGAAVAAEIARCAPYTSQMDFAKKVNGRIISGAKDFREGLGVTKGVMKILDDQGVLDTLEVEG